jgi:four helix bundle protein
MTEKATRKFIFPFEKLEVWQLAVDLADFVLGLLKSMPPNQYIRVIGHAEAAVTSVAQNIAEGKGRQYKKEFIQFLYVSEGSLFELLTLVHDFINTVTYLDAGGHVTVAMGLPFKNKKRR